MKLLIIGLFPVLIFWAVEEFYGTKWGLVAAIVWAVGECSYEWIRYRKIETLTLVSSGLVVGLGGLSAWLDSGILFKFQPSIVEVLFAGMLFLGGIRNGEPVLLKMIKKTRPEIFKNQRPEILELQKTKMTRITFTLIAILILHAILMGFMAVSGSTGQWAFWKGIGFNIFLAVWVVSEIGLARLASRFSHRKKD